MPTRSPWNRPIATALLFCCCTPLARADSSWTEDGDDTLWSNPDNWNTNTPGPGDSTNFNPAAGPFTQTVTIDSTVTVFDVLIRDWPGFTPHDRYDVEVTMTGEFGTSLNANTFTLSASEGSIDTGLAAAYLIDMEVNADPRFTLDEGGELLLSLDNSSFNAGTSDALTGTNLTLLLDNESVFGNSAGGLFTIGDNTAVTIAGGSTLGWRTSYDDANGQSLTFESGGGIITHNFGATGDIAVNGTDTFMIFGDPDGTAARSAGISGSISGTGGVVVANDNYALSLLGSNSFTGGLYLLRGTVSVGAGSNLGGLSNFMEFFGGTLHIYDPLSIAIDARIQSGTIDTDGHDVTYTGDWLDSDGFDGDTFTKTGLGTLTLNNNGAGYTGALIVDQGTVVSGNGNTFSNQTAVTINTGATLRFDQAENFDGLIGTGTVNINGQTVRLGYDNNTHHFAGQLAGTGLLAVTGPGTQRFSGDNTAFTGSFAVNGGTLAFTNTQSASGDVAVADGANLVFEPDAGTLFFNHALTGEGNVDKQGSGTLNLSSDTSAFAGRWNVFAGRMSIDGTAGGISVYVADGASVAGGGTVAGLLYADAGATIEPGNGSGVLSAGSLIMEPGSALEVQLAGTTRGAEHDALSITNTATLAGTLDINLGPAYFPEAGDTFDLLDAGSITGTFDDIHLASLFPVLRWDLTDLYTTGVISVFSTGDANGDGTVGIEDLDLVLANWGAGLGTRGLILPAGDVTGDFAVDNADLQAILDNWGSTVPPNTVPEPATAALLAAATLALTRRRR